MISQGSQGIPAKDQKPPHATGRREITSNNNIIDFKVNFA